MIERCSATMETLTSWNDVKVISELVQHADSRTAGAEICIHSRQRKPDRKSVGACAGLQEMDIATTTGEACPSRPGRHSGGDYRSLSAGSHHRRSHRDVARIAPRGIVRHRNRGANPAGGRTRAQAHESLRWSTSDTEERVYWIRRLDDKYRLVRYFDRYLRWADILLRLPMSSFAVGERRHHRTPAAAADLPSWGELAREGSRILRDILRARRGEEDISPKLAAWMADFEPSMRRCAHRRRALLRSAKRLAQMCEDFAAAWTCGFSTTPIGGFSGSDTRWVAPLTFSAHYDLLASEARLTSLVAIAKGDVPVEHWLALGRPYTYFGRPGSAFLERNDVRVPDAASVHAKLSEFSARECLRGSGEIARSTTHESGAFRGEFLSPPTALSTFTRSINIGRSAFLRWV